MEPSEGKPILESLAIDNILIIDLTVDKSFEDSGRMISSPDILIQFPSSDEAVEKVCNLFHMVFDGLQVDDVIKLNLRTALEEAVSNALRHGNKHDPSKIIRVLYRYNSDKITIRVKDDGPGFDPKSMLKKEENFGMARNRAKERKYGGLGLTLIHKSVDEVVFNDKANMITMTKYLKTQGKIDKETFEVSEDKETFEVSEDKETFEVSEDKETFEVSEDKETFEVSEETVDDKGIITYEAKVRYFKRMSPEKNFPLSIILSKQMMEEEPQDLEENPNGFDIDTSNFSEDMNEQRETSFPFVEIVPIFPGCLCTPPVLKLNIFSDINEAKLWITPNTEGELREARVELWYQGRLEFVVPTPAAVVKQSAAKLTLLFTVLIPVITAFLDVLKFKIKENLPLIIIWIRSLILAVGGVTDMSIIVASVLLVVGASLYYFSRPLESKPVQFVFSFDPSSSMLSNFFMGS